MSNITVTVWLVNCKTPTFDVLTTSTVYELKNLVSGEVPINPSDQNLLFNGISLVDNDRPLGDYGIGDGSWLELLSVPIRFGPLPAENGGCTVVAPSLGTTIDELKTIFMNRFPTANLPTSGAYLMFTIVGRVMEGHQPLHHYPLIFHRGITVYQWNELNGSWTENPYFIGGNSIPG